MALAAQPPHVRQVAILGAVAAALIVAVVIAAFATRAPSKPVFAPEPYFASLEARAPEIQRILIQSRDSKTEMVWGGETGWVLPEKDGYRADYQGIQKLVFALIDLDRFEPKTASKEWHKELLLTDPREGGEGTLVQLLDAEGKPIAQVVLGLSANADIASGRSQVYARAPAEDQVWLVRGDGVGDIQADAGQWVATTIIDLPRARVARAVVAPEGGEPYVVVRANADAENFTVENLPAGRTLLSETSANGVGSVLAALALRDVAGADRITFTPANPSATYETFNGLRVRIETAKLGEDSWARLIASTTDAADAAAKAEAADLQRRLGPWVFQLESWKASQLATTLASITGPATDEPGATENAPSPH